MEAVKTTFMPLVLVILLFLGISEAAWKMDDDKKVRLRDIDVLTLHHGKMTKGRRSSPVPQLECVNQGTASCTEFKPRVVQCINRGSDGYDVQWECKTDMDNTFRFGHIEVSCEGYDYPDDPYVLHGSCGLKYSLDYTKEGMNQGKHDYYGDSYSNTYSTHGHKKSKSAFSSMIADILVYIGMGLIAYAFYKTCINPGHREGQRAYSSTNDDYPSDGGTGGGGYGWFGGGNHNQPPPSSGYRYQDDASCRNRYAGAGGTGMGGGGFWTGAATGGLLGYMFGNRNTGYGGRAGGWGGTGGGWGGSGGGWGSGGGGFSGRSSSSGSSGTRTASGFGGTSRR